LGTSSPSTTAGESAICSKFDSRMTYNGGIRKAKGFYVVYPVTQAMNRPASLSYQHSSAKDKEDSPPCIATANQ
jgi:hypothetical protein